MLVLLLLPLLLLQTQTSESGQRLRPLQDVSSISCPVLRQFPGKFPQIITGCYGGIGLEK